MRIDVGTHVYAVNGQSKPVSAKEQKHSMNAVFRGEYIDGVWQIGTLGSLQSSWQASSVEQDTYTWG